MIQEETKTPEQSNEITMQEEALLDAAGTESRDDENLQRSMLDDVDEDGTPLNEKSSGSAVAGSDLDVPGSGLDDDMEDIGSEDEENNNYSQADTE